MAHSFQSRAKSQTLIVYDSVTTYTDAIRTTLVYTTAWFAIFLYLWTTVRLALERRATPRPRFLWSAGCLFFLVHVAGAFDVFHGWSHDSAYKQTMQDTMNLTGVRTGVGIYLNYIFTLLWLIDMIWWWVVGDERYRKRHKVVFGVIHFYFLFMIFNGAYVFVDDGWLRWMGLGLSIGGFVAFIRILSRKPARPATAGL